jgi:hypothetical protein
MRKKQLILAFVFMVVLGLISWLTRDKDVSGTVKVGDLVFADVKSEKMNRVILETPGQAVTELILKDRRWLVKSRFNMDADPSLIRKLKTLILKAKAVHVVPHEEKDLKLFQLDKSAILMKVFEEGKSEPQVYRFGKTHIFHQENSGRYIYLQNKQSVVLLAESLSFITGHASVWLKKYLPPLEQLASTSLFYEGSVLWKTDRNHPKAAFQLVIPKEVKDVAEKTKQLMYSSMQLRFMDITPALNDFEPDKEYAKIKLYFSTFSGRRYELSFLKKDKKTNTLRCRLSIISSKTKTEFHKQYNSDAELVEELKEWHFIIPFRFYEKLFVL